MSEPVRRGVRIEGDDLAEAIEAIVDYRGDVTIERRDAPPVVGFLFDCADRTDPAKASCRVLPQDDAGVVTIPLAEVIAIEISGRDTAEGKSFETWVRKYAERKLGK